MDNNFIVNSSDWDYAVLSKSAHENGGPEKYVGELYNNGYSDGYSDGYFDGQAADVANAKLLDSNVSVVVVTVGISLLVMGGIAIWAWVSSKGKRKNKELNL